MAPESGILGAKKDDEETYKGRMEVAPRLCERSGTAELQEGNPILTYEQLAQSVHEMPTKHGPCRIHQETLVPGGPTGPPCQDFETNGPVTFGTMKKETAFSLMAGRTLGACGHDLLLKILEVLPLRSQTMGRRDRKSLFPLPTSRTLLGELLPTLDDFALSWMVSLCLCLNSFWGGPVMWDEPFSDGQAVCLRHLSLQVLRLCRLEAVIEHLDWASYLQVKSVDYQGEEVKVARWFCWDNISPSFPEEVGAVPLENVCSLGCLHYVTHFDDYLKPPQEWVREKPPKVMVDDTAWGAVCKGLVDAGVCVLLESSEVFHLGNQPLLNGLFGVTKEEWTAGGTEIFRLIMNLVPLNAICRPMAGDVDTLPSWGSMSPFFLQPSENLLVSSEDVKCFFYTMSVPVTWWKFLAFNKAVPDEALPVHLQGHQVYLASRVLPMGFLNSVSLAQHVHRNLVAWGRGDGDTSDGELNAPECELRKDRSFTVGNPSWRVYLDNYDLLEKVEATRMTEVEGTVAAEVIALRQEYQRWGVPRNFKKAVERSHRCEVQGATIDGLEGVAFPRESKLCRYFALGLQLALCDRASQKQWQIVCGGLVYFSMFRRPLLGCLNAVWRHIESYKQAGAHVRVTPHDCRLELLRFLGMLALAKLDFRLDMHPQVTCSDASSSGGGVCASVATTAVGRMVAGGALRGQVPEARIDGGVLVVGLFDGIGALRVSLDVLGISVLGYVSVEKQDAARRVVERHYPGVQHFETVESITSDEVKSWSTTFSQACLVLLGAGPPCQGVSGLNSDRKEALKDQRSCLFQEVPRIRALLRQFFPWCPIYTLMESVASMDQQDREVMSQSFGGEPIRCDAGTLTWCHRPRLYWCDWEIIEGEGFKRCQGEGNVTNLILTGCQSFGDVVRSGWWKVDPSKSFPTFTTSRPRSSPGRKPAGVQQCTLSELGRWQRDRHRFPPYQYCASNCLVNQKGELRLPDVAERELMLGFPLDFTKGCFAKNHQKGNDYLDCRLTLLGNSWSVPVVSCLLMQLLHRLGMIDWVTPQQILEQLVPGTCGMAQGRLFRLPLNASRSAGSDHSYELASKLGNLISIKGEDIMLTTPTTRLVKFHRLRATIPAKCWRWKVVTGWKWKQLGDHINGLELRAILTSVRWRLEHCQHFSTRFIHLTDSLVCLHALTRGRSSSRKLRRPMSRLNALILASGTQPLWGYVRTDQNPADRPSRWGRRVKTKYRHAKA